MWGTEKGNKQMGIGPMTVMSEDVLLSKHMVDTRRITTKEGDLVPLQVCYPPKQIWSIS
jgi:hypothetical protein